MSDSFIQTEFADIDLALAEDHENPCTHYFSFVGIIPD